MEKEDVALRVDQETLNLPGLQQGSTHHRFDCCPFKKGDGKINAIDTNAKERDNSNTEKSDKELPLNPGRTR